ncbi:uncharacterized protein LOC133176031 [Saccostrea echinata]|uniref:uncharacterized protein LOC133176031 n=1 Tax=Saccostrea echinata TaxID=191078 RepID=UPI002A82593F|nr:uncharacterized protein LOC133176031 [Saccostrea echinata]
MGSQLLTTKIITLFSIVSVRVTDAGRMWFCKTDDPCQVANTTAPYQPQIRAKNCPYNNSPYCDRFITPGWYRFKEDMLNYPPSLMECGAVYPSWLNGTLPTKKNEEVERTVCKIGFKNTCARRVTIIIKQCGSFNAYCLPSLGACSERYCFGERDVTCEQIPSSPQDTTPPMVTKQTEKIRGGVSGKTKEPSSGVYSQNQLLAEICKTDPCTSRNLPRIPYVKGRGENCKYTHFLQSCDRDLFPGWYKAEAAEPKLLNRCPDVLSCAAIRPVWMDGIHPTENEGIVKRDICVSGFGLGNTKSCCHERSHIYVRNCGRYMAYCLKPLKKCEERYCLENNVPCTDGKDNSVESSLLHSSQSNIPVIVTAVVMIPLMIIASTLIIVTFLKRNENNYVKPKKLEKNDSLGNGYTCLKFPEKTISKEGCDHGDTNVYCMINDVQ